MVPGRWKGQAWYVGLCVILRPSSEKTWFKRRDRLCLWKIKPFSTLHAAFACGKKPCFNVLSGPGLRRKVVYQRSGAPGQPSGGRAGGCKQPRFTRGVKRSSHRASPAPCTVCPALTGACGTRAVERSGVVRRSLRYSAPVFGKNMVQTPGQALFVENKAVFNASCCFCLQKKALFQRVVGPRFAKEGRVSTLWGPRPAFRRPGRWMQAAAIHSRR